METVKEHCKHKDCKWRGRFNFQPACMYMMITGRPRGTEISECDKHEPGKIVPVSTMDGFKYKEYDL